MRSDFEHLSTNRLDKVKAFRLNVGKIILTHYHMNQMLVVGISYSSTINRVMFVEPIDNELGG